MPDPTNIRQFPRPDGGEGIAEITISLAMANLTSALRSIREAAQSIQAAAEALLDGAR